MCRLFEVEKEMYNLYWEYLSVKTAMVSTISQKIDRDEAASKIYEMYWKVFEAVDEVDLLSAIGLEKRCHNMYMSKNRSH